jgi:hypothetical protein
LQQLIAVKKLQLYTCRGRPLLFYLSKKPQYQKLIKEMKVVQIVLGFAALLSLGHFALKEGLHQETEQEKMYKVLHPSKPIFKRYPKWYLVLPGCFCCLAALYLAFKILF